MAGFALGISVVIAIGIGFGLAFLIIASLVKKSNDIGDSWSGFDDFARMPISYRVKENARKSELDNFIYMYGNTREWKDY